MKTKKLFFAAIIVMASIAATGCKKDSSVTPVKNYQTIKLATTDSTDFSGGHDHTLPPPK